MIVSAKTKLRLLALPTLAVCGAVLASQSVLRDSIWGLLVAATAVVFSSACLFWYLTRGHTLVANWAQQMKSKETPKGSGTRPRSTEDRLDELERLKRRDMITPEEYAAKRQDILKDL